MNWITELGLRSSLPQGGLKNINPKTNLITPGISPITRPQKAPFSVVLDQNIPRRKMIAI